MYIKLTDGVAERYTLRQLSKDHPNTSFPKEPTDNLLTEWGVYPYTRADEPLYDAATQVCEQTGYAAVSGIYSEVYVVRDQTADELAVALAATRSRMICSKMQGILTLGETKWGEILAYRDTATWFEKVIIDDAIWVRSGENGDSLAFILNYDDTQMDALFIAASEVTA